MTVSNAGYLVTRLRSRSDKYVEEVRAAVRDNANLVYVKARQFSQRRFFSLAQLRKMGHPYAVRNPRPPVRAHIINRQSGALYGAWRVNVKKNPDGITCTVMNTAPWAKYMLGTKKMIARPILDEAVARTKAERDRNLHNARRRGYYRETGK